MATTQTVKIVTSMGQVPYCDHPHPALPHQGGGKNAALMSPPPLWGRLGGGWQRNHARPYRIGLRYTPSLIFSGGMIMIKGVHTMFYSSKADELRAFFKDKLGFPFTDVGQGWLIFDLPEADLGCHPVEGKD